MHRSTYLIAALLSLAFAPATAQASGPSVAESLQIADRFIGPHQCAGKVQVLWDPSLRKQGVRGRASGMTWDGSQWFVARCEITLATDVAATTQCYDIVHEVKHLATGSPNHEGPMHTDNLNAHDCSGVKLYKRGVVKVKKKRTKAQIARSLRYKRQMAKIRARAAARR